MDTLLIFISSICFCLFLKALFHAKNTNKIACKLPQGPPAFPLIGNLFWLRQSLVETERVVADLMLKFGPILTLRIGSRPLILIASHSLAHQALVQNSAVFADRPPSLSANKIFNSTQHNITSAAYGPTWRLLRRNLTAEILHPSRIKQFSHARKRVLDILINRLFLCSQSQSVVIVHDHFQFSMFCLLVLMCFGDMLNETQIKEVQNVQCRALLSINKINIFHFFPRLHKFVFHHKWKQLMEINKRKEEVLTALVREGMKRKSCETVTCYADTLSELELPEKKRKLNEGEIVSLCSEFLSAGTDTTTAALQWIMANLVKNPQIQSKLYEEMKDKISEISVGEEDLQKLPYLKAVVLEGLRRHPPTHVSLPHAVTQETWLDGYLIPKNAIVSFMVAQMGWDPQVWDDPMAFKPERFIKYFDGTGDGFDVTGSGEVKMMPFGVGRRICPAWGLATLHLEYFVANLVWYFKWTAVDGDGVDLVEKQEFTVVMKTPLRAHITPRLFTLRN